MGRRDGVVVRAGFGRLHHLADRPRLQWGEAWTDTGLVSTAEGGTMLHPEWVTKEFIRLAKATNLPAIRLHDLRHSYASSALAAGVPIKALSKRLGDSSIM